MLFCYRKTQRDEVSIKLESLFWTYFRVAGGRLTMDNTDRFPHQNANGHHRREPGCQVRNHPGKVRRVRPALSDQMESW